MSNTNNEQISVNENFGLSIIAENNEDLQLFKEICLKNFLPISNENSYSSAYYDTTMIDHYLMTSINYLRSEYAIIILLKRVCHAELSSLVYEKEFSLDNKVYSYQLRILIQSQNESNEELITRIRCTLLGEVFVTDHDDHQSIPTVPAPLKPQFVSILPHTEIACWPLPRRRALKGFQNDLDVTHILSLLNPNEIIQTNILHHIQLAGIESLHVPIQGADLPIFTSSQATIDILIEKLPSICNLLLNSTAEKPVKMIIHCSAGLHRTGTITFLLLRLCHFTMDQALLIINRTRAITARQVGKKRIDAAENNLLTKILEHSEIHSILTNSSEPCNKDIV